LIPKPVASCFHCGASSKCLCNMQAFAATRCYLAAIFAHRQQKLEMGFG
jgi:hypothetical protein